MVGLLWLRQPWILWVFCPMQVHHIRCPWGSDRLTRGWRGQANVVYIVWAVCTRWGGQHRQEPGCWALCHFNWWGKDDSHVETVQFLLLLGRGCPGLTPYRKVLTMQVLYTAILTGMVSLGFSQGEGSVIQGLSQSCQCAYLFRDLRTGVSL